MELAEVVGLAVLIGALLLIVVIAVRRAVLIRAGGFDVSWRVEPGDNDRGWLLGQARYRGGQLVLYRSFSPFPVPALRLDRSSLRLGAVREPTGVEPDLLPTGAVIVPGRSVDTSVELAMSADALNALRSWVESRPPGSRLPGRPASHWPPH